MGKRRKKKLQNAPRQQRPCRGGAGRHQIRTPSSAPESVSRFLVSARNYSPNIRIRKTRNRGDTSGGGRRSQETGDGGTRRAGMKTMRKAPRGKGKAPWRDGSCRTPLEGERREEERDSSGGVLFLEEFFRFPMYLYYFFWL